MTDNDFHDYFLERVNKRLSALENHLKEYHELMLGQCPFDLKGDNYKELKTRIVELDVRISQLVNKRYVEQTHERIDKMTPDLEPMIKAWKEKLKDAYEQLKYFEQKAYEQRVEIEVMKEAIRRMESKV